MTKPKNTPRAVQSKARKLTTIFTHSLFLKEKITAISRGNAVITPEEKNAHINDKVAFTGKLAVL